MKCLVVLGLICLAIASHGASADVLYDNFGPNDSFHWGGGLTISSGDTLSGMDWDQGFYFTVTGGDYSLDTLEFAMSFYLGETNRAEIMVYDSVDGLPGNLLESVRVGGFGHLYDNNPLSVATFSGTTILRNNHQYFFIASSFGNSWMAWNVNTQGVKGRIYHLVPYPWLIEKESSSPAARVNGTLVPAPAVLPALIFGLLAIRRRRSTPSCAEDAS